MNVKAKSFHGGGFLRAAIIIVIVTFLPSLGIVGCDSKPEVPQTNLIEAHKFVSADATSVFFTDWSLIKKYKSVSTLNSSSPFDNRREFMLSLLNDQFAASTYDIGNFSNGAQIWKWDSTDLDWEITIPFQNATSGYVLKFRNDFDISPVLALFDQRGFSKNEFQGVSVYSHEQISNVDWLPRVTDYAILNTAVRADKKIFVLSSSIENVRAILSSYQALVTSGTSNSVIQLTSNRLMEAAASILSSNGCQSYDSKKLNINVKSVSDLHAYQVLGFGYRFDNGKPLGVVIMHYPNENDARADLEARKELALNGKSRITGQPYNTTLFTLENASVEDNDIVLRLRFLNNQPRTLFEMNVRRDMTFALCP